MMKLTQRFLRAEAGATAIEYALIATLIAVVIVAAVTTLGVNLGGRFGNIANQVK
jgi:pilus assembly protein Flp/PilA